MRSASILILCGLIMAGTSCSRRDQADPKNEEWNDIQALEDDAVVVAGPESTPPPQVGEPVPEGEFDGFIQRLEQMKTIQRQPGETLLTGKTLI